MVNQPAVRDVELSLLSARKRRRQEGDVPYPIAYSRQMADFDIWDHMFLNSYFKGFTMHQFVKPPATVLDIGCGSGYWAMEAAKHWPAAQITGFDIVKIQPLLHKIDHLKQLSRRIEWVHGNLLDGLPFCDDRFDFVRIAGLGLAIPEDEWQGVFEEIYRVMKPGAALEVVEEDLIFPCPSALLQLPQPPISSPISATSPNLPYEFFKSKSTVFYERTNTSPVADLSSMYAMGSTSTLRDSMRSSKSLAFNSTRYKPSISSSSTTLLNAQSTTTLTDSCSTDTEHPQDHTRLKLSWDAMLSDRFLSPKVISVIPFYLTSSSFVNTQAHTPLVVPLPPNSGPVPTLKTCRSLGSIRDTDREQIFIDTIFDFGPSFSSRSVKSDGCSIRSSFTLTSCPPHPTWDTMHLAKTVSTIRGCKEAIWTEYKRMYGNDALQILLKTAPSDEDYASFPFSYVMRHAFEVDWRNWEFDMMDRMDMRNNLLRHINWVEKPVDPEGTTCEIWRKKLDRKTDAEAKSGHLVTGYSPDDLCRSLRSFTGFKA